MADDLFPSNDDGNSLNTEDISVKEKKGDYLPLYPQIYDNVTQDDIVAGIKTALMVSPLINPSKTLVNSVYNILKSLFLDKKRFVIIEAPTGSGKTIIGFITHFAIQYIIAQKKDSIEKISYFLTSNKLLQEQIDSDLDRFDFREFISMLKGLNNYPCTHETEKLLDFYEKGGNMKYDNDGREIKMIDYSKRPCKGMKPEQKESMFAECIEECPYESARYEASQISCAVLNYHYFLNIMRIERNPYFSRRPITISDEAHLLPEIVCNIFNFEITQYPINTAFNLMQEIELNFGQVNGVQEMKELFPQAFATFKEQLIRPSVIENHFKVVYGLNEAIKFFRSNKDLEGYKERIDSNIERFEEFLSREDDFKDLLTNRPRDLFFESEKVNEDKTTGAMVFKHIIKDLSEAKLVKDNFLSKIDLGVFMSATIGDIDEYAEMMGMEPDSYAKLRLPSTFDFDKSPIYNCKSGWLNFKNFDSNIDKVLMDCIYICNQFHPKEKGIIHTATFKITNKLKEKIYAGLVPDPSRFLFYRDSKEKEQMIEQMKKSQKPYIIVGPSLYEGLDLKDDLGRFNILIKVPYAALTDYIKKKMERFPFWYSRNTKEKIVQAIGRTNRHTNDYSKIYCLDGMFDRILFETNDDIVGRIESKRIYATNEYYGGAKEAKDFNDNSDDIPF